MSREINVDNKVALVTGAGRGIGKAIALTLAEAGADIIAVARTPEQINATADEVRGLGRTCLPILADVTKSDEVELAVKQAIATFKKIDILVNNAGTVMIKPLIPIEKVSSEAKTIDDFLTPTTNEDWYKVVNSNLTSVFFCTRAVGPYMIERQYGKIINLSSLAAQKGRIYRSVYGACKSAVNQFTKTIAVEWGKYNINVNAIAPGIIKTSLSERLRSNEKLMERELSTIPLRRLGEPREVGLLALYLASDASSFVTGQIISLDGGQSL